MLYSIYGMLFKSIAVLEEVGRCVCGGRRRGGEEGGGMEVR